MQIVNDINFATVVERLSRIDCYGLDTETYGLGFDDLLFSIQISTEDEVFYFNFLEYSDGTPRLDYEKINNMRPIFDNAGSLFWVHNAKFDARKLSRSGISIKGKLHCTEAIARVLYNAHDTYSLDACAFRALGINKDDRVKEWIMQNKAYTIISVPDKKKKIKNLHFDKVPSSLMIPYACKDAEIEYALGKHQLAQLEKLPELMNVYHNECELTKTCFRMEERGIKIDRPYIERAIVHEGQLLKLEQEEFERISGIPYANGPKLMKEAFDAIDQEYVLTDKGNPCFNKEALKKYKGDLPQCIRNIRQRMGNISIFYSSFLHEADRTDCVHASIRQSGTESGRFSYTKPNLQNVPKEEDVDSEFVVRKSFIPREDYCFVMLDYDQQEFRLMLDYAGEHELIKQINEGGLDVHEATAQMLGIKRKEAKTLNFGLLYGMGVRKLAAALGVSEAEATSLRQLYFSRLPGVSKFIKAVIQKGERQKYVHNWFGRNCHIRYSDQAYILPNHIIQGGGADIIKIAMNRIQTLLDAQNALSGMVVQVHDELVLEVHKNELQVVPEIKKIMETVYKPMNAMQLTVGCEYSWKSWGQCDKQEGFPNGV